MNRQKVMYGAVCVCLILMLAATTAQAQTYTFVNMWGSSGTGDGQFDLPWGVETDGSDNLYVADYANNRIQKFASDGTYITQWGSFGTGDGQFDAPVGVAVDGSGDVYVSDYNNHRIQKFTSDGTYITQWGTNGASDGQFNGPGGVAVDGSGNVYVADSDNYRIQKFTSDGTYITQWGTNGTGDGQFRWPFDVAVDSSDNVYALDTDNHCVQKFTSDGTFIARWGALGGDDGEFAWPYGIAVDASDDVYVADSSNNRIQKFTSDGTYITQWGSNGSGNGQFSGPSGLVIGSSNNVYVADTYNNRIQVFTLNTAPTVTSVALTPDPAYTTDDLLATPSGWSDPDSDPEGYNWQWEKDTGGGFAVIAGQTTATLGSANFIGRDVVRVTCTPNDGSATGTPVTDVITITNTAPTTPTVTILPVNPTSNVSLRATTSGSADPDGDPVSYSYQWYKDGVLQPGRIYRSLGARWTRDGETWRVVLTPNDGFEDGPTGEGTETVGSVISAPTVVITPEVPVNSDTLLANASGSADSDGDPISYTYQWFKDGVEQVGVTWRRLGAWRRQPGQTWRCVATPTDGINIGPTGEDSVTLELNTPPTAPTVVMMPAAPTTADSFKAAVSSTDVDGDPISYAYQWYKDGVEQTGVIWCRIGAWRTRAGQTWRVVVTPNDGFDDGPTGEATVVIAAKGGPLTVSGLAALPTAHGAEVAFTLSADAAVTCEVLNIAGRAVKTIVSDRPMAEGINSLAWDGKNAAGLRAPAGVYLVRMTATTEGGSLSTSMGTLSLTR